MQLHGDLHMHVGWISNAGSFSHPMLRFDTLVPFESRITSIPLDGTLLCLFSQGKNVSLHVVLSCFMKFGSSSKLVSFIKDIKSWQTHTLKAKQMCLSSGPSALQLYSTSWKISRQGASTNSCCPLSCHCPSCPAQWGTQHLFVSETQQFH